MSTNQTNQREIITNIQIWRHAFLIVVVFAMASFFQVSAQSAVDGFDPLSGGGEVSVVVPLSNGQMYVGGNFTTIGGLTRSGIALLNHDGSGNTLFNAVGVKKLFNGNLFPGTVHAIVVQNDGKIIIGGDFTEVNGVARTNLARIDQFGNLDTGFVTNVSGPVFSLALLFSQDVIVGGAFTTVNGIVRSNLARISTFGNVDTTTNFDVTGSVIYELKFDRTNGITYVGGVMSAIGGITQSSFARLNTDGKTVDTTFKPQITAGVSSISIQADRKIVVGTSTSILRLNPDGTADPTLNIGTGSWVNASAIQGDGKIVFGGFFTSINGTPRNHVARLNLDGTLDAGFNPNVASANADRLEALEIQRDGKILIGGRYETVGGISRLGLSRVYQDGALDATTNLAAGTGIPLAMLPVAGGKTLVGGSFTTFGGLNYSKLARINANGTVDTTFPNLSLDDEIDDIAIQSDGKTLIAGGFTTVGGISRPRLARLNVNGTLDTSFTPAINNRLFAVAIQTDGKILIGGIFTNINGTIINNFARLNSNGTLDTTFNSLVDQGVYKIRIQPNGKILIGGGFGNVGGTPRVGIARINPNGSLDNTISFTFNGIVQEIYEIAIQNDGKILFGGSFTGINGSTTNLCIARLLASGAVDTTFTGTADSSILSIAIQADGKIIAAGRFTSLNATPRVSIGRFNSNGTLDTTFTMNANDTMTAIALQRDGKILAGGNFTNIGGQTRGKFARISNTYIAAETAWTNTQRFIEWNNLSAAPQLQRVTFEKSTDGINYTFLGDATLNLTTTIWSMTGTGFGSGFIKVRGYYPDSSNQKSSFESVIYVPATRTLFDFDGDNKSDISIFRPSNGEWYYTRSIDGQVRGAQFGASTDKITPGDFTGDGKADFAFFRPSTGEWFVIRSEDSSYYSFPFGSNGDIPMPGDYDGDGKADVAVFRPSTGIWYINRSGSTVLSQPFGISGDVPVAMDYDGDGKSDIAIFRPSVGEWYYMRSSDSQVRGAQFGSSTDKPVQGDYTGDGKADFAFFRPSEGRWYVLRSENSSYYSAPFGVSTDVPTPGDFDGDGKFDFGVFRPSNSVWYVNRTTAGMQILQFGFGTDIPVPAYRSF